MSDVLATEPGSTDLPSRPRRGLSSFWGLGGGLGSLLVLAFVFSLGVAPRIAVLRGVASAEEADPLRRVGQALSARDAKALESALQSVVEIGGAKAMRQLLSMAARMGPDDDAYYWRLLEGVASFVDRPGLEELGEFLVKQRSKSISRDITYTLLASQTRQAIHALRPLVEKGGDDVRLPIVEKIGTLPSAESVELLIRVLEIEERKSRDDPSEIAFAAEAGLRTLTGKDFGTGSVNWDGWWKANRATAELGIHAAKDAGRRTGTAVDHLDSGRKKDFVGLEKAPQKGVVVLSAHFEKVPHHGARDLNNDHMENVLSRMRIPHTIVSRENFLDFELAETGAILVNCAQFNKFCVCPTCKTGGEKNNRLYRCQGCNKHVIFEPGLKPEAIEKLKNFVLEGGYVFCEDWIVKEFIEPAFPQFVVAGTKLTTGAVDIVPARGRATHPYLRGIFVVEPPGGGSGSYSSFEEFENRGRTRVVPPDPEPEDAKLVKVRHSWSIDDESFALHIENPAAVTTLLTSGDLGAQAEGDAAVAVAFRPGAGGRVSRRTAPVGERRVPRGTPGVVLQVLSHFGKQGSRLDEHTIENLLLNFLIEANVVRESRVAGR